ncbi:hypothetical protein GGR50DRAFT_130727 [Xylaria sp. CBS 124048]|nr:hypothetical protein GGR50DRAFT_130727 [Xylaria sp. CBS 124048]
MARIKQTTGNASPQPPGTSVKAGVFDANGIWRPTEWYIHPDDVSAAASAAPAAPAPAPAPAPASAGNIEPRSTSSKPNVRPTTRASSRLSIARKQYAQAQRSSLRTAVRRSILDLEARKASRRAAKSTARIAGNEGDAAPPARTIRPQRKPADLKGDVAPEEPVYANKGTLSDAIVVSSSSEYETTSESSGSDYEDSQGEPPVKGQRSRLRQARNSLQTAPRRPVTRSLSARKAAATVRSKGEEMSLFAPEVTPRLTRSSNSQRR